MLSVESLLRLSRITRRVIGYKGATPMQLCVLVANDGDIFERSEAVEGRKNVLFIHGLGNLERDI